MNHTVSRKTDPAAEVRRLCEQGRWTDALVRAEKWAAEFPEAASAHFYQGVALAALNKFQDAETAYYRALALDEHDFKIWNNLAALLFTALNRWLLVAWVAFAAASTAAPGLLHLHEHFGAKFIFWIAHLQTTVLLFLGLAPLAITMALIWKTKEVILDAVFGGR